MLGISLLKCLPLKAYTFTDCHYKVINSLIHNLKINFKDDTHQSGFSSNELWHQCETGPPEVINERNIRGASHTVAVRDTCHVEVRHLDWLDMGVGGPPALCQFDFILGSDIVYERSLLPGLCTVIRAFLQVGRSCMFSEL